jgi:hypothetical protein
MDVLCIYRLKNFVHCRNRRTFASSIRQKDNIKKEKEERKFIMMITLATLAIIAISIAKAVKVNNELNLNSK